MFLLLVAEMALFMLLVTPLPFTVRRKMFTYEALPFPSCGSLLVLAKVLIFLLRSFISENPLVAKLQYGLKITFIFILILFIDSVNRVYRVQTEQAMASDGHGSAKYAPPLCIFLELPLFCHGRSLTTFPMQ